jgi:hypothetical protein
VAVERSAGQLLGSGDGVKTECEPVGKELQSDEDMKQIILRVYYKSMPCSRSIV